MGHSIYYIHICSDMVKWMDIYTTLSVTQTQMIKRCVLIRKQRHRKQEYLLRPCYRIYIWHIGKMVARAFSQAPCNASQQRNSQPGPVVGNDRAVKYAKSTLHAFGDRHWPMPIFFFRFFFAFYFVSTSTLFFSFLLVSFGNSANFRFAAAIFSLCVRIRQNLFLLNLIDNQVILLYYSFSAFSRGFRVRRHSYRLHCCYFVLA